MAKVVMYCTAVCPYCVAAERLLKSRGVTDIEKIRIDLDPTRQAEMIARSNGSRSVPQVFINDQHIGGFDDTSALDAAGKLVPMLEA
ncbi:MAG: glutaredoxin 3 [Thiobacillus sp.]|nr:glutaredoxin 3 [Thiobacillus sp.]